LRTDAAGSGLNIRLKSRKLQFARLTPFIIYYKEPRLIGDPPVDWSIVNATLSIANVINVSILSLDANCEAREWRLLITERTSRLLPSFKDFERGMPERNEPVSSTSENKEQLNVSYKPLLQLPLQCNASNIVHRN
jgi:hypothetical protein